MSQTSIFHGNFGPLSHLNDLKTLEISPGSLFSGKDWKPFASILLASLTELRLRDDLMTRGKIWGILGADGISQLIIYINFWKDPDIRQNLLKNVEDGHFPSSPRKVLTMKRDQAGVYGNSLEASPYAVWDLARRGKTHEVEDIKYLGPFQGVWKTSVQA